MSGLNCYSHVHEQVVLFCVHDPQELARYITLVATFTE